MCCFLFVLEYFVGTIKIDAPAHENFPRKMPCGNPWALKDVVFIFPLFLRV